MVDRQTQADRNREAVERLSKRISEQEGKSYEESRKKAVEIAERTDREDSGRR